MMSQVRGSSGLVVKGGDSCSKGCGFESQHRILDWHFSHLFVAKIVMLFVKTKKTQAASPFEWQFIDNYRQVLLWQPR